MQRHIVDSFPIPHIVSTFSEAKKIKFFIGPPEGDIEEGLQLGLFCFESYQTLMILCTIHTYFKTFNPIFKGCVAQNKVCIGNMETLWKSSSKLT